MSHFNQTFITLIIDRYKLELDDYLIDSIVVTWLQKYDRDWIVKAIVESIHRGRYKVKSVDSILISWHRLGKPAYKFPPEFEREILQSLPIIPDPNEEVSPIPSSPEPELPADPPIFLNLNSDDLNPEESAPFQHHNHSISKIPAPNIPAEPIVGETVDRGSVTLRSTSLTTLQHRLYIDLVAVAAKVNLTEVTTNQLVAQPAKFQLFQKLKAIVEPRNHQILDTSAVDGSSSYNDAPLSGTTNFEFSLGNASGE